MKQELWDVYNKDRIITGKKIERGNFFLPGQYHLVAHVCFFNSKGEMLIQLRSIKKPRWAGKWDFSAGGAAICGEDSQRAAERETLEELGVAIDLSKERPAITINFDEEDERGFDDYYLIKKNIQINKIMFNINDVQKIKWASEEEILEMIEKGEFKNFYKCFIQLLFILNQRKSTHCLW